jgi:hypothetical protein
VAIKGLKLGAKVRSLRSSRDMAQVELARRLEISASYLNLIEHDQRPLTAPLLLRLAQEFELDLADFDVGPDQQLCADVAEVFADDLLRDIVPAPGTLDMKVMQEQVGNAPALGQGLVRVYHAYREAQQSADLLASQIYDGHQELGGVAGAPLASEEVSDFIQRQGNSFEELERLADRLRAGLGLALHDHAPPGLVDGVSVSLTGQQLLPALRRYLEERHDVTLALVTTTDRPAVLRAYDPTSRVLALSEGMPPHSRLFQTLAQLALIEHGEILDRIVADGGLAAPASRSLGRVVLANYFAGAVMMPYAAFRAAAGRERYDVELLGHRFGASFEQVCHRLTCLQRPGQEGVPFHMIRVDLAGNISKRFSATGIRFARFAGACPRWNVFSAFLAPGTIRVQISVMPDGGAFFCFARTVPKGRGGYHTPHTIQAIGLGCRIEYARQLVYSDGVDLDALEGAVPIGITCRLCERTDCEQRAFPSIRDRTVVDENRRGPSFYGR